MKLRSGKVLPTRHSELPEELENILERDLENFKTLFSGNSQHAKELLKIISMTRNDEIRFAIRSKVGEIYDENLVETHSLMGAAGKLACFLLDHPEYRIMIVKKIENFDLNISSLEDTEISAVGEIIEYHE